MQFLSWMAGASNKPASTTTPKNTTTHSKETKRTPKSKKKQAKSKGSSSSSSSSSSFNFDEVFGDGSELLSLDEESLLSQRSSSGGLRAAAPPPAPPPAPPRRQCARARVHSPRRVGRGPPHARRRAAPTAPRPKPSKPSSSSSSSSSSSNSAQLQKRVEQLSKSVAAKQSEVAYLRQKLQEKEAEAFNLRKNMKQKEEEIVNPFKAELARAKSELSTLLASREASEEEMRDLDKGRSAMAAELKAARAENKRLLAMLAGSGSSDCGSATVPGTQLSPARSVRSVRTPGTAPPPSSTTLTPLLGVGSEPRRRRSGSSARKSSRALSREERRELTETLENIKLEAEAVTSKRPSTPRASPPPLLSTPVLRNAVTPSPFLSRSTSVHAGARSLAVAAGSPFVDRLLADGHLSELSSSLRTATESELRSPHFSPASGIGRVSADLDSTLSLLKSGDLPEFALLPSVESLLALAVAMPRQRQLSRAHSSARRSLGGLVGTETRALVAALTVLKILLESSALCRDVVIHAPFEDDGTVLKRIANIGRHGDAGQGIQEGKPKRRKSKPRGSGGGGGSSSSSVGSFAESDVLPDRGLLAPAPQPPQPVPVLPSHFRHHPLFMQSSRIVIDTSSAHSTGLLGPTMQMVAQRESLSRVLTPVLQANEAQPPADASSSSSSSSSATSTNKRRRKRQAADETIHPSWPWDPMTGRLKDQVVAQAGAQPHLPSSGRGSDHHGTLFSPTPPTPPQFARALSLGSSPAQGSSSSTFMTPNRRPAPALEPATPVDLDHGPTRAEIAALAFETFPCPQLLPRVAALCTRAAQQPHLFGADVLQLTLDICLLLVPQTPTPLLPVFDPLVEGVGAALPSVLSSLLPADSSLAERKTQLVLRRAALSLLTMLIRRGRPVLELLVAVPQPTADADESGAAEPALLAHYIYTALNVSAEDGQEALQYALQAVRFAACLSSQGGPLGDEALRAVASASPFASSSTSSSVLSAFPFSEPLTVPSDVAVRRAKNRQAKEGSEKEGGDEDGGKQQQKKKQKEKQQEETEGVEGFSLMMVLVRLIDGQLGLVDAHAGLRALREQLLVEAFQLLFVVAQAVAPVEEPALYLLRFELLGLATRIADPASASVPPGLAKFRHHANFILAWLRQTGRFPAMVPLLEQEHRVRANAPVPDADGDVMMQPAGTDPDVVDVEASVAEMQRHMEQRRGRSKRS